MAHYYQTNSAHFKPWAPSHPHGFHTAEAWAARIQDYITQQKQKSFAYFVAYQADCPKILAHCTLSQIYYGPLQACYMGYGVAACAQGTGTMHRTCKEAIRYAFDELNLNRIMANYMPHNNRSAKLLQRLGFQKEGLAKNYLKIDGRWEHHVLTSLVRESKNVESHLGYSGRSAAE